MVEGYLLSSEYNKAPRSIECEHDKSWRQILKWIQFQQKWHSGGSSCSKRSSHEQRSRLVVLGAVTCFRTYWTDPWQHEQELSLHPGRNQLIRLHNHQRWVVSVWIRHEPYSSDLSGFGQGSTTRVMLFVNEEIFNVQSQISLGCFLDNFCQFLTKKMGPEIHLCHLCP